MIILHSSFIVSCFVNTILFRVREEQGCVGKIKDLSNFAGPRPLTSQSRDEGEKAVTEHMSQALKYSDSVCIRPEPL
jgi:hypothetical protein